MLISHLNYLLVFLSFDCEVSRTVRKFTFLSFIKWNQFLNAKMIFFLFLNDKYSLLLFYHFFLHLFSLSFISTVLFYQFKFFKTKLILFFQKKIQSGRNRATIGKYNFFTSIYKLKHFSYPNSYPILTNNNTE